MSSRETSRAKRAYADYLALGDGRTLEKLAAKYRRMKSPPTVHLSVIKQWSSVHDWQARLRADADAAIQQAREKHAAARQQVLELEELAQDYGRVRVLIVFADTLIAEINAEGAEFDEAKYRQLRGVLDDIAKEVGDRAQRHEYTLVERKAAEIAIARGLDPGKIVNLSERLARRGVAG